MAVNWSRIGATMRGVVRPIITVGLVCAQIALALMFFQGTVEVAKEAFGALSPFTSMAMVWWFKDRSDGRES